MNRPLVRRDHSANQADGSSLIGGHVLWTVPGRSKVLSDEHLD